MNIFLRANKVAFKVFGPDAHKLLNDVFTGHIPSQEIDATWWALLSPQGKIQAEGLIGLHGDAYWLDINAEIAPKFLRRMGMYKLRADAKIKDLSQSHQIGWSKNSPPPDMGICHKDSRHADLGFRVIAEKSQTQNWKQDAPAPITLRTELGIPELGLDFVSDNLFPHDIGMDLLGGVDFAKGCYVGQEVVSRMRHRGKVRRRPVSVHLENGKLGDEIMLGEKTVGTIGHVSEGRAVGIVRLDRIGDMAGIHVNGKKATLMIPPWADYDFASSSNPDK